MLDLIDEFDRRTHANEGSLASVQLADEGTIAQSVLNNNRVLLADLKALFSQKRAEYLPGVITRNLRERFAHLAEAYNNLEQTSEPNHARRILGQMDELYAYCLQYGLITFGFRGKERSQIVQNLRNKVNATEAELATLDDQIRAAHESVAEQLVQIKEALGNAHSQAGQDISKKAEEFTQHAASCMADLDSRTKEYANDIEQKMKASTQLIDGIAAQLQTAQDTSGACKETLSKISATREKSNQTLTELTATATAANEQLTLATSHANTAATQLQNATQHAGNAKAKSDAIAEHLGVVEQRREEIDAFYAEIESHKKEMLETKKRTDADVTELKERSSATVEEFRIETASIIDQNKEYQEEIKELLHKAVSAGLFGVFKQRQEFLSRSRKFWMGVVAASTIALAVAIVIVAWLLSEKADVIFFVRLGVMIPLGFFMYFAAGQYKKERQAEEEYAFKSSISFSLEPYRDLLVQMREEDNAEADFVRSLMVSIFENPVKRLYKQKDENAEVEALVDTLTSFAGEIPAEKKKILLDALRKTLT